MCWQAKPLRRRRRRRQVFRKADRPTLSDCPARRQSATANWRKVSGPFPSPATAAASPANLPDSTKFADACRAAGFWKAGSWRSRSSPHSRSPAAMAGTDTPRSEFRPRSIHPADGPAPRQRGVVKAARKSAGRVFSSLKSGDRNFNFLNRQIQGVDLRRIGADLRHDLTVEFSKS